MDSFKKRLVAFIEWAIYKNIQLMPTHRTSYASFLERYDLTAMYTSSDLMPLALNFGFWVNALAAADFAALLAFGSRRIIAAAAATFLPVVSFELLI